MVNSVGRNVNALDFLVRSENYKFFETLEYYKKNCAESPIFVWEFSGFLGPEYYEVTFYGQLNIIFCQTVTCYISIER